MKPWRFGEPNFDRICQEMEESRARAGGISVTMAPPTAAAPAATLRQLGAMQAEGFRSDAQFERKRAEVLARV